MSIPIRNIWWLMLYASDLGKSSELANLAAEDLRDEIPDLIAEILVRAVERRQRRQLSKGFLQRKAVLSRVRGRIDHLETTRRQLLAKGQVACRFEELTIDSPRNRFVRTALETVARLVSQPALAHRCRILAYGLRLQGVVGEPPSQQQIYIERFSRNDACDQAMVSAARLAMEMLLPTEEAGPNLLLDPDRCVQWLRRLYEKAIGGFYRVTLNESQWAVKTGKRLSWPLLNATAGIVMIFPSMRTDIVIDRRDQPRRLVIDTKFTNVLVPGWHRSQSLSPSHIYQLYAYLRSQEGCDNNASAWADAAAGLLLHPAIDENISESVEIQGHRLQFATLDLTASHSDIRKRLLQLLPWG